MYIQKDWQLSSYSIDTDTDFIVDTGTTGTIIKAIMISNTTVGELNASITVTSSIDATLSIILPLSAIDAMTTARLDVPLLSLTGGDKVRVSGSGIGLHFSASGAEE
jgi:hypothetical protein